MTATLPTRERNGRFQKGQPSIRKGVRWTDADRQRLSDAHRGKRLSPEHRAHIKAAMSGRTLSEAHKIALSKRFKGRYVSPETRRKLALANIGKSPSPQTRVKIGNARRGFRHTLASRQKISLSHRGERHYRWNADREALLANVVGRTSHEYEAWRKAVWERDNFKCQLSNPACKGKLNAHHIKPWARYPDLRFAVSNGITLCHKHHPRGRMEDIMAPKLQALVDATMAYENRRYTS